MPYISRFFKNTSWLLFSDIATKLILFSLLILIARHYSIENFGIYTFSLTFIAFFEILLNFGFNTFIIQKIAGNKSLIKEYLENILSLKLFLTLILSLCIIPIVQIINDPPTRFFIYLAAIFMIGDSFNQFFRSFFIAFEKFKYDTFSKIIQAGVRFFVTIIFLYFSLNISFMLYAHIIAVLFTLGYTIITVKDKITSFKPQFNPKIWKKYLSESKFFLLHRLLAYIYIQTDVVLIYFILGSTEVGFYQVAFKILIVSTMLLNLIYMSFLPILSSVSLKKIFDELVLKFNTLCFVIITPIIIYLIFFADRLIPLIFGVKYTPTVLLVQLLAIGFLIFYGPPVGIVFTAANKQHIIFYTTLIGAFLNLIFNLILIPKYGIFAAAVTTILTYLLIKIILVYYYKRELNISLEEVYKKYFYTIVVGTFLATILAILNISIISISIIYPMIYFTSLYLFILTRKEKELSNQIIRTLLKKIRGNEIEL